MDMETELIKVSRLDNMLFIVKKGICVELVVVKMSNCNLLLCCANMNLHLCKHNGEE